MNYTAATHYNLFFLACINKTILIKSLNICPNHSNLSQSRLSWSVPEAIKFDLSPIAIALQSIGFIPIRPSPHKKLLVKFQNACKNF